ncbi:hypothetical protein C0Q70_18878 [Pomacea canaliculata]|uniref:Uncharacterized protein n=1 Tax=Pomacea canaliculata TaxID=400727 RepID=A0A2T7NHR5_POMCA|nr:hypothetical protein C0Q70_18878 [Pomacea canaliculata]
MAAIKAALPVVALLCIAVCALASIHERFGEHPKPLSFSQDKDLDHKIDRRDVWSRHNYISHNRRKRSLVVDSNLADVSYLDIPLSSLVVHSRQRRAVTDIPEVSVQFSENQAGQVLSFTNYVPQNVSRTYMLVSSSVDSSLFTLSSLGILNWISANSLDYETTKTVTIVVNATSTVDKADVYVIRARINVTDVNEPAVFITKPQPYQATLTTIAPQDTLVISLQAQDPDAGASVGYSLTSVNPSNLRSRFTLNEVGPSGARSCEIRTVGSGQFTQGQPISITVTAKDNNDATASPTTTTVSVLVGFLPPQFMELFYEGYAQENNQPMQMVYTQPDGNVPLKIETKSFQPSPVTYSLLNSNGQPSSDFTVDSDAVVKNLQTIDYETAPSPQVQLTVRAVQVVGTTTLIPQLGFNINDNSPEFEMSRYLAEIPENTTVGTAILEDVDDHTSLWRLDYDRTPNHYYDFVVVAADQGKPTSRTSTTSARVFVRNTNDEAPMFTNEPGKTFTVAQGFPVSSVIAQIQATDLDGDRVRYSITGSQSKFSLAQDTGIITLLSAFTQDDYEFVLNITARDDGSCCGGGTSLSNTTYIVIQVMGTNNYKPTFTTCSAYDLSNVFEESPNNSFVIQVSATDQDRGLNGRLIYTLVRPEQYLKIVPTNGTIYVSGRIDREAPNMEKYIQKTQYSLRVMAKDKGVPPLNSTVSVTVNVIISSNKPPSFDKNYTGMVYTVNETAAQGFPIIQDITCNSNIDDPRVDFQLADANSGTYDTSQFFYIRKSDSSPNKATVYSNGVFDFETKQSHIVRLRCLNYGSVTLSTEINPVVQLLDANNKRPTFVGTDGDGRFQGSVTENMDPGQECLTITGQDLDVTPDFSKLTFEISAADNGTNNMDFELVWKDNRSAVLKSKRSFDRESKELYLINVIAKDGAPSAYPNVAPNPNSGSVTVRVLINDVNDNPPYFEQTLYNLTVPEDFNLNTLIEPYITAEDPDSSDSNRLTYFIDSGNGQIPTFGVREGNGGLFLVRKLDYENNDRFFQLKLRAFDGIHSATTTVNVLVTDVNDNSPVLLPSSLIIRNIVEEDQSVRNNPRLLLQFNVTDADVDRPNKFQFSITSTSLLSFFRIDSTTGQLFLTDKLDRDLPNGRDTYIVDVQVTDELTNPLSGFASVSVLPLDINDNDPMFVSSSLVGSVNENSEKGSSVMLVQVFDPDYMENGTVVFSILNSYTKNATGNYFAIDANTGYVTTNVAKELLDREKDPELYMVVKLADKGTPPRSTTGTITISLTDVNDNPPIFQEKIYKVEMSESLPVGGNVVSVTATDADIGVNANLIYDLQSSADRKYFDILTTKNVGNIIVFKAVDYDPPMNERFFNLTVSVTDGRFTDTCYVEIKVTDFNDNAPQIQPQSVTVNISENVVVDYLLANFSATDIDEGINSVFQFSIDRQTDLLRQFTVDPSSGVVRVRRPLDRETTPSYSLHILAIDEGNPVQTGTATLNVILGDVNDNYPTFKDNYRPQVPENDPNYRDIQVSKSTDTSHTHTPNKCLFLCTCTSCFYFIAGDNGNGTAVITSKMTYDREKRKYYLIPIIMWDMYGTGSSLSQTGTNTLTVTIADKNDNPMKEGHQDIFVFNYKGMFGPIDIGRVYVNDPDDWDLPDKTFTFLEPKWMEAYFKVQSNGTIVMEKGVPSNSDKEKYTFSVEVVDNVRKEKVVATVSVVVNDLSDEAVRSSGAVRLQGISAEDFIKRPPLDASTYGESPYDKFRKLLAAKLGTALENVLIISVQDVEGGDYTDVRYTAHGSPYYQSSQTDSLVVNNLQEFENTAGVSISQVPIDMCAQEIFEGGCYNYLDITGRPAMVNANGTSFVGVEAFVRAREGCRAKDFPDPVECSGNYCYNGGTCQKDDFGVLSCLCLSGYDGPRCQQLRHSFDGKSYAMYPTLEQCEDGQTSIEFITTQSDGLLLYNGPKVTPPADQPPDFISLELRGGFPVLMIDHGSGSTTLTVDGKNANGNAVISTLADGKWHRIDIIRTGKHVEMIVDFCEIAAAKSGGGTLDDRPCRATGNTPGTYSFLNVGTLLQVGGRQPSTTYPRNVVGTGFNGCVRNLRHNSKIQNGTLQVIYNLDDIEKTLELSHGNVSNGQWHVVRVMRNLQHVTLILDGGEGRNYNFSRGNPTGNFSVTLRDTATVGAVMSSLQGQTVYDRNLIDTCVQDIRLNNVGFPMTRSENTNTGQVSLTLEMNVKDGCTRNDCASNLCPLGTFCYPLWGMSECRCNPGTHYSGKTCMSDCTPNPCFNDVQCSINNGSAFCTCPPEWCGPLCQYYMTSSMCGGINDDQYDSAGITAGGIAAIVVSIIAALLIVLFAVLFFTYCRKKELEKVVLEDEDDYDIRENVIYYNEEGAGEEDQNAYDLDTLRKPVRELQPDIRNAPLRREPQLGRAVPGDRPDVGDTIHDRMRDADDDSDAPPYDTIHEFNVEGGGSDAGSLSSLATSSTDTSQDYDYLNDWGPKFAKLADMYGAGQDDEA